MWNQADEFDFKSCHSQALEDAIRKRLEEKSTARLAAAFVAVSNPRQTGHSWMT